MKIHTSVTAKRVMDAVKRRNTLLDDPGICVSCGFEQDGCEPDAREYQCESCGLNTVYGAEELLIMGAYHEDKKETD